MVFVGKHENKSPFGRCGCRWGDNIEIDLKEIRWQGMSWILMAENRHQWQVVLSMLIDLHFIRCGIYQLPEELLGSYDCAAWCKLFTLLHNHACFFFHKFECTKSCLQA